MTTLGDSGNAAQQHDGVETLISRLEEQLAILCAANRSTTSVLLDGDELLVALPWLAFDSIQQQIARHQRIPREAALLALRDRIGSLDGRSVLDVGAFTGLYGIALRQLLSPGQLYLIEAQETALPGLQATAAANAEGCEITVLNDVIDDGSSAMTVASGPAHNAGAGYYLRREGGERTARSIDDLGAAPVGLIHLDFRGTKIYAMRGAERTLREDRPFVAMNLEPRHAAEMTAAMAEQGYDMAWLDADTALFSPV